MTTRRTGAWAAVSLLAGLVLALWLRLDGRPREGGVGPAHVEVAGRDPGLPRLSTERAPADGRTPARVADPLESEVEEGALLCFLAVGDRSPAAGSTWRLVADAADGGRQVNIVADSRGTALAPSGRWRLRSADGAWRALQATIELGSDERRVVWAQRLGVRRFRLVTPRGDPVADARGLWLPGAPRAPGAESLAALEVRSDEDGLLVFEGCPCDKGTAVLLHPGFERERLSFSGRPAPETLRVVMRPTAAARRLRFTALDGVTPVLGVSLSTSDEVEIARADDGEDALDVPAWVPPHEPLRVRSPSTHPCTLQLARVDGDDVALPLRGSATVELTDATGCPGGARLDVRTRPGDELPEAEPIVATALDPASLGVPHTLELPRGHAVVLSASNACGGLARAEFVVGATPERHFLTLRSEEGLTLRVRDARGRPLPDARARTSLLAELRADAHGVLHVPRSAELASIEVVARGYVPALLGRNLALPAPSGGDEIELVLATAVEAEVEVVAPDGSALPGMRVRIWPWSSELVRSRTGAWVAGRARRSWEGTTDAAGRVVARGLSAGRAEIEVDLPVELGTDAFLRSAYGPVRTERVLGAASQLVVEAPRPATLSLEVVERSTGGPVEGFELAVGDGPSAVVGVTGAHWQGWVSSDLRVLRITVEGLGAVELAGHELELGARRRVEVGAQPTVTIRVEGLPFAPAGTRLAVEVLRGTPEGLHLERSSVAELDASAEARIALDGATERWVGLPATVWEGRRLRFTPERQRARPGGAARFTLVE